MTHQIVFGVLGLAVATWALIRSWRTETRAHEHVAALEGETINYHFHLARLQRENGELRADVDRYKRLLDDATTEITCLRSGGPYR